MYEFNESEIEEFTTEATELLDSGEKHLLLMDKGADFTQNYDAIFRVFHSLKGASGMLGLKKLNEHMHQIENYLTQCKSNGVFNKKEINYFLDGIDAARDLLEGKNIKFDYSNPNSKKIQNTSSQEQKDKKDDKKRTPTRSKSLGLIYVVDDESDICENLTEYLENFGFNAKSFTTPEEALKEINKKKPNLVFTDIKMPKMSGFELLQEIFKLDADIPVIYTSGYLTKEILIKSLGQGVFSAIEKPFEEKDVIRHAVNATKKYDSIKLLDRSMKFIMYQFSDLDNFLEQEGKEDIRTSMKEEIRIMMEQRRKLKEWGKEKND